MSKAIIDIHDLAKWMAETEAKKSNGQIAEELYKTRGKDFCVGLIMHLAMYVSGNYSSDR